MTPAKLKPNTITLGNEHDRQYTDAFGRPLRVGDFIAHAIARSSSVHLNVYKIDAIKDTDKPAYVDSTYDEFLDAHTRIESWDRAFSLRVIRYEFDGVKNRVKLPQKYQSLPPTYEGTYVDLPEADHKRNTIKAVQRVIRLDLDA